MNQFEYRDLIESRFVAHMAASNSEGAAEHFRKAGEVFRAAFGEVLRCVLPEHRAQAEAIPIGVALLRGPNAVTLQAPNGIPCIIFDWNLTTIFHDVCLALSPEAFRAGRWPPETEYGQAHPEKRAEWFYDSVAVNFHLTGWWLDQHWRIGDLDKDRYLPFYMIFILQTWFIVAHEIGHCVLGHLERGNWVSRMSAGLGTTVRAFSVSHQMEFEADRYALDLLMSAPLPSPFHSLSEAAIAEAIAESIDILFSLFLFLEATGDVIAGRVPNVTASATRPQAVERADTLRAAHGHVTPNMGRIREAFTILVRNFQRWPRIKQEMNLTQGLSNQCLL